MRLKYVDSSFKSNKHLRIKLMYTKVAVNCLMLAQQQRLLNVLFNKTNCSFPLSSATAHQNAQRPSGIYASSATTQKEKKEKYINFKIKH